METSVGCLLSLIVVEYPLPKKCPPALSLRRDGPVNPITLMKNTLTIAVIVGIAAGAAGFVAGRITGADSAKAQAEARTPEYSPVSAYLPPGRIRLRRKCRRRPVLIHQKKST